MMTMPSTTSTTPVARFRVLGVALLANTAAMRAHSRVNSYLSQIHETRESFTAKLHAGAEKNTRARMALLQIAQQENLVPTDEEIDKMIAERAERTKKTVEEIREKTNIPALKRAEAIRRAADWVIERSTIEEK